MQKYLNAIFKNHIYNYIKQIVSIKLNNLKKYNILNLYLGILKNKLYYGHSQLSVYQCKLKLTQIITLIAPVY